MTSDFYNEHQCYVTYSHANKTYAMLVALLLDELEGLNVAKPFQNILDVYMIGSAPCQRICFERGAWNRSVD